MIRFNVGNRTNRQVKTEDAGGAVYEGGVVSKKVEAQNNVMRAGVQDGELNWYFVSCDANSSCAETCYGGCPAVGDSYNVGGSRRHNFVQAAAKG